MHCQQLDRTQHEFECLALRIRLFALLDAGGSAQLLVRVLALGLRWLHARLKEQPAVLR